MPVTRSNILTNPGARGDFIRGVKLLKQEVTQQGSPSTYDVFVIWHHNAMVTLTPPDNSMGRNAAHIGPVFLPWHRYLLIVLEQQLQRVLSNPDFGLPYWNWGADGNLSPEKQPQSDLWKDDCMGGNGSPIITGPFAFDPQDPNNWRVLSDETPQGGLRAVNRGMRRSFSLTGGLPKQAEAKAVVQMTPYDVLDWDASADSFRNRLEGWTPDPPKLHNSVHVWVSGDMGLGTSPNDPVFYLNHANVDRIWAAWQQKNDNPPYLPDGSAPEELKGHRVNDAFYSVFPNAPTVADMLDVSSVYTYDTLADLI